MRSLPEGLCHSRLHWLRAQSCMVPMRHTCGRAEGLFVRSHLQVARALCGKQRNTESHSKAAVPLSILYAYCAEPWPSIQLRRCAAQIVALHHARLLSAGLLARPTSRLPRPAKQRIWFGSGPRARIVSSGKLLG